MPAWGEDNIRLVFTLLILVQTILRSDALVNGTVYTIEALIATGNSCACNGQYLGYETKGTSSRPFLVSATATKPPRWRARELRKDVFVFEAVDQVPTARGKLAYSSACDVRRVLVSNGQLRYDWRLTVVDRGKGFYRINAAGKDCSASALNFGRLGPATMSNGGCRCGSERNLTLMSVSPRTQRISWRFKRAASPALPTPRRPPPPSGISGQTDMCHPSMLRRRKILSGRRLNSVAYDPCSNRAQDPLECCLKCRDGNTCKGWFFTRLDCSAWGHGINEGACYLLEDVVLAYEDQAPKVGVAGIDTTSLRRGLLPGF